MKVPLLFQSMLFLAISLAPIEAWARPGDPFKTMDDAAIDALDHLAQQYPDRVKFEYGGCVYKRGGHYYATEPRTDKQAKWCVPSQPPDGLQSQADYHNHTSKEDFSEDIDKTSKITGYLLTPKGWIKKWLPKGKQVITLRKGG
jgi:hypothetical protein